ncbi:hypothetical protein RFI_08467 [Reticulomyxa filosa]|uniref:Multifunctional methyltransferase subunit TRM112-like protein n=1 Tax=Reticulomyxa filosa TaxID=46433 RepID=X6NSE1_RETFI|nr:hypothetical protein RFI_08467 [Reticulomyxa filosa]|eukprot:ETO28664.1 hypothetical protein RFI_08467 [Reticulomyxa filosa]
MRLLTHNMLHSRHKKGVRIGYPLKIVCSELRVVPQTFNKDFVKHRLPLINWTGFTSAITDIKEMLAKNENSETFSIDMVNKIPRNFSSDLLTDEFLKLCHHLLFEIVVFEGYLECPETKRQFPIKQGIPNMLLREDELSNATFATNEEKNEKYEGEKKQRNDDKDNNENENDNANKNESADEDGENNEDENENDDDDDDDSQNKNKEILDIE